MRQINKALDAPPRCTIHKHNGVAVAQRTNNRTKCKLCYNVPRSQQRSQQRSTLSHLSARSGDNAEAVTAAVAAAAVARRAACPVPTPTPKSSNNLHSNCGNSSSNLQLATATRRQFAISALWLRLGGLNWISWLPALICDKS